MPWGPLKSGLLSGKYSSAGTGPVDTARAGFAGAPSPAEYLVIDLVNEIAAETGTSPAAVALAWIRARPGVTSTVIGARRMDQFEANLTALDLTMDPARAARLASASAPHLNFPAENNGAMARIARNGGTTVDGVPTPAPPRLFQGTRMY
jgi:aryl-alcohol dehydrogenase-like predicted oxidoreductase